MARRPDHDLRLPIVPTTVKWLIIFPHAEIGVQYRSQAYGFRDMEFFKLKILAIHETKYALVG